MPFSIACPVAQDHLPEHGHKALFDGRLSNTGLATAAQAEGILFSQGSLAMASPL